MSNYEEDLINDFVPYELEELTKETILNEDIFKYLIEITDPIVKETRLAELRNKAKQLGTMRNFNNIFKAYQNNRMCQMKQSGSNVVQVIDAPLKDLKCGQWIADESGVYKIDYNNTFQPIKIKACSHPIIPIEKIINYDTKIEKVKLAFYKDNEWNYFVTEKEKICSNTGIVKLSNRGIEVNSNTSKNLVTYLADVLEINNIPLSNGITHIGWVDDKFVPYTKEFKYDGDIAYKSIFEAVSNKGNYEEWKSKIRELRLNNKSLRFLIASSFASPLVKIFQINPFIVHLWGKSGNGKTVAQMICASIWGNPAKGKLLSSLDSTKVASERLCNFLRNIPLIVDELQITKTKYKTYDVLIYELTEGKGKDRGTVDGGLTEVTEWDNIIIISGEEPITNDSSKEGVKNRVIEIEENSQIIKDGNTIVNFILNNYGYAGKDFIENLPKSEELKAKYNEFVEKLKSITTSTKQINAMATILVADEIVSKTIFEDDSFTVEDVKDYFTKDIDEIERYKNLIYDYFFLNINNFNENSVGQCWGKYEKNGEEVSCFYINSEILKTFLKENNINFNGIKDKLCQRGILEKNSKGRFTIQTTVNGAKQNLHKINIINSESIENANLPF